MKKIINDLIEHIDKKNEVALLKRLAYVHLFLFLLLLSVFFAYRTRGLYNQGAYNLSKHGDFNLRYNEICAAHERINSFLVWDGQISSDKYIGFERPDKVWKNEGNQPKMAVHAYPPWHITYFYFYGWIPRGVMNILFLLGNCVIVFILFACLQHYCISNDFSVPHFILIIYGMSLYFQGHIKQCINLGNYTIIISALSVAFYWALEQKKQFMAGIIWAIMMTKPHVVLLFFWPLFFARQWKAIAVAVITCLLATLFPAYLFKQSPVDLILEISKIGAPYCEQAYYSGSLLLLVQKICGANSIFIAALIGFCLCGALCFLTRRYSQWWQKCLPVMLVVPYWTYTQRMDRLIGWNVLLVLILVIIEKSPFTSIHGSKRIRMFFALELGVALLSSLVFLIPRTTPHAVHGVIDFIMYLSVAIAIIADNYKSRHAAVQ